jgi:hypothetical protein
MSDHRVVAAPGSSRREHSAIEFLVTLMLRYDDKNSSQPSTQDTANHN